MIKLLERCQFPGQFVGVNPDHIVGLRAAGYTRKEDDAKVYLVTVSEGFMNDSEDNKTGIFAWHGDIQSLVEYLNDPKRG